MSGTFCRSVSQSPPWPWHSLGPRPLGSCRRRSCLFSWVLRPRGSVDSCPLPRRAGKGRHRVRKCLLCPHGAAVVLGSVLMAHEGRRLEFLSCSSPSLGFLCPHDSRPSEAGGPFWPPGPFCLCSASWGRCLPPLHQALHLGTVVSPAPWCAPGAPDSVLWGFGGSASCLQGWWRGAG